MCTILYSCPGNFYPRSPCGERRSNPQVTMRTWQFLSTLSLRRATFRCPIKRSISRIFLSTLSLRRATLAPRERSKTQKDFYPRSPCGERPKHTHETAEGHHFYPRSPCGERPINGSFTMGQAEFLSTLSLRRATTASRRKTTDMRISIHALLAESDGISGNQYMQTFYFYPRSPCGERR